MANGYVWGKNREFYMIEAEMKKERNKNNMKGLVCWVQSCVFPIQWRRSLDSAVITMHFKRMRERLMNLYNGFQKRLPSSQTDHLYPILPTLIRFYL